MNFILEMWCQFHFVSHNKLFVPLWKSFCRVVLHFTRIVVVIKITTKFKYILDESYWGGHVSALKIKHA